MWSINGRRALNIRMSDNYFRYPEPFWVPTIGFGLYLLTVLVRLYFAQSTCLLRIIFIPRLNFALDTITYRHGMCFRVSSVFVLSILFWFPQRSHYFWRVFRFLFMERKQDYNVKSLKKKLKFAFKDVSTKNSEPTYWTILFVMLKIYFFIK